MEPPISPSTNVEAAFGRLHNSGMGAFGARPIDVECTVVHGEVDGSIYDTNILPYLYPRMVRNSSSSQLNVSSGGKTKT